MNILDFLNGFSGNNQNSAMSQNTNVAPNLANYASANPAESDPGIFQSIFMASRPGQRYYQVKNDLEKRGALQALVNQLGNGKFSDPAQEALLRYSALSGEGIPSALKEYLYTQGLPKDAMDRYLATKRATQVVDTGGAQTVIDPLNPQEPRAIIPKTLPPSDQPLNAEAKAAATARGSTVGEQSGTTEKNAVNAEKNLDLIKEVEKLLPKSTSGAMQRAATGTAKFFGQSTDASKADARLKVLSAALTSTVPRFEGPQGVLDVELYKQAAADVANSELPFEDRLAAVSTMKGLQQRAADKKGGGANTDVFRGVKPNNPPNLSPQSGGGIKFLGFEQ